MMMNEDEYVENFNKKTAPNSRKLSLKIMRLFEKEYASRPPYFEHSDFRDKVVSFLAELNTSKYIKLSDGKLSRKRDQSLLKNTRIGIKSFPIDDDVHHSWEFLAYDLEGNQKYFWNSQKRNLDSERNENQVYFNPEEMIDDFLTLDIKSYPLGQEDKRKIINFLGKYGPYFIRYYGDDRAKDKEWYFWHFWIDFVNFKKSYELIKCGMPVKFPDATRPPRIANKFFKDSDDKNWRKWDDEINDAQVWFKISLNEGSLPAKRNGPEDIYLLGRGIGIACNYLYSNRKKLITCGYSRCSKTFFQESRNQSCCCPHHSTLTRNEKYKEKQKIVTKS